MSTIASTPTTLSPAVEKLAAKIMIVDDEPINIMVARKYLKDAGYADFITTEDPRPALNMIREESPDVIILDIMMPHINGLEILEQIRRDSTLRHLPVLILTATTDETIKVRALELGATDFLTKPVKPTELIPRVRNACAVKELFDHLQQYSGKLEESVRQRTHELDESRLELIQVLACAAEYRDQETGNHVLRVGRYTGLIAEQLGFDRERVEMLEQAAILHDVGKIGIPDSILLKPGRLTDEERKIMMNHCQYGMNILRGRPNLTRIRFEQSKAPRISVSPVLKLAAIISNTHHEKWDGSGYPNGLKGEEIPIEGRITAVADVFDALSSKRCYKPSQPLDQCLEILLEGRGKHFDPQVLDAFFACLDQITRAFVLLGDD
jgi:putative two-component system response regulator